MSFWVCILRCADNSYYTGHTDNLEQRIDQHQQGLCGGYTASRLPVELVFSQECATREAALAAEQQIKGWSRKKKEAMMRGDWAEVSRLAKGTQRDGAPVHPSTSSGRTGMGSASPTEVAVRGESFDKLRTGLSKHERLLADPCYIYEIAYNRCMSSVKDIANARVQASVLDGSIL